MTFMFRISDDFEVYVMVRRRRRGSATMSLTFVRVWIGIELHVICRWRRWRRFVMTIVLRVGDNFEVYVVIGGRRSCSATRT